MIKKIIVTILACTALTTNEVNASEHAKQLTPLSNDELLNVLRLSHNNQFGFMPTKKRLAMAWAQVALENDRGKMVWNYNIGNLSPRNGGNHYYHTKKVKYASYENFLEGGMAYWRTVVRCTPAIRSFDKGDPSEAASNLKKCNYYEASVESYDKGLSLWFNFITKNVILNQERERLNNEKIERERHELELRLRHSPSCGCSSW